MSEEAKQDPVHYCDWLALLGFEAEQDALRLIQDAGFKNFSSDKWLHKIRSAISAVNKISNRRESKPEIKELDKKYDERLTKLRNEPTFQEHLIGITSNKFALVELTKIHSFQKMLNMEYVNEIIKKTPSPENMDETVKFCLPTKDEREKTEILSTFNPNNNTVSMITDNLDFRIIGNIQGEDPITGRKFSGFGYGFGLPLMSVVEYKGIYLIRNGYHRAYALLKKGHKFLPCLLLSTDSYQFTGAQFPAFFSIDSIMSDKSPLLSDFETDVGVLMPRRRLKVVITVHAETQVLPV